MNKLLFTAIPVAAFLMSVASGIAWSDGAASNVDTTVDSQGRQRQQLPGRYPPPPPPGPGWYPGPWGSPPVWVVPPQGYRQPSPWNPANGELDRLLEKLAALRSELDAARKELQQGEIAIQEARAEAVALQSRVTQLSTELAAANALVTRHQEQVVVLVDERDQLKNTLATRDKQLASLTDKLQAANAGIDVSRRELAESQTQAQAYKSRLDDLDARLDDQKQTMLHARQLMAEMNSARETLRADLSASTVELTRVQATLARAQAQAEQLSQNRRDSLIAESPERQQSVQRDEPVLGTAEVAAMESTDTGEQVQTENTPTEPGAGHVVASAGTGAQDADRDGVPDSLDLCPATPDAVTVESTGCAVNATIPLEGVNFRYNSHDLTDGARLALDRVAGILSQQADIRLEVAGHTDSQGNAAYNRWLSQQRAQAVRDYLVERGLDPKTISARGYGDQQPVADNTTVEGLVQNRRVELRNLP